MILFPEYQEVSAALSRVQKALGSAGESALAARVAGAAGALLCPELRTALGTRSAVLTAARHQRPGLAPPHTHRATDRLKEVSVTHTNCRNFCRPPATWCDDLVSCGNAVDANGAGLFCSASLGGLSAEIMMMMIMSQILYYNFLGQISLGCALKYWLFWP